MTADQMRNALLTLYKLSPTWPGKVNRMSDQQVVAVYLRMKRKGRL